MDTEKFAYFPVVSSSLEVGKIISIGRQQIIIIIKFSCHNSYRMYL